MGHFAIRWFGSEGRGSALVEIGRRSQNIIPYRIVQVVLTGVLVAAFVITLEPKDGEEDAGQSEMASIHHEFREPVDIDKSAGRASNGKPAKEREELGQQARQDADTIISYEVLRRWNVGNKFSMELLVSDMASQNDVLKLAESLQRRYAGQYNTIDIFDSRMAWQSRADLDESYPDKEYWRHYLVQISEVLWQDNKIHWVAKGRGH